jgi:hypothetical protein
MSESQEFEATEEQDVEGHLRRKMIVEPAEDDEDVEGHLHRKL